MRRQCRTQQKRAVNKQCWVQWKSLCLKRSSSLTFTSYYYTNIYSMQVVELNVKIKIIQFREDNIGNSLHYLRVGKDRSFFRSFQLKSSDCNCKQSLQWETHHFRPKLPAQFCLSKREHLQKHSKKVARPHFGQATVTSRK